MLGRALASRGAYLSCTVVVVVIAVAAVVIAVAAVAAVVIAVAAVVIDVLRLNPKQQATRCSKI